VKRSTHSQAKEERKHVKRPAHLEKIRKKHEKDWAGEDSAGEQRCLQVGKTRTGHVCHVFCLYITIIAKTGVLELKIIFVAITVDMHGFIRQSLGSRWCGRASDKLRAIRAFLARLVRFQRPKLPSKRQGDTLRNRGADPYTAAITLDFPDFIFSNLRLDHTRFVQAEEPRSIALGSIRCCGLIFVVIFVIFVIRNVAEGR
jgi:uncharacterized DUF497 family protein